MASFLDLVRTLERDPIKSLYYVAGEDSTLREEVIDGIRLKADVETEDYVSLSVSENGTAACWDAVMAYADTSDRRCVLIRDAEKLKGWSRWWEFAEALSGKYAPSVTAILASSDNDFNEITAVCKRGHGQTVERTIRGKQLRVCGDCEQIKAKMVKMSGAMYVECGTQTEDAALKILAGSEADGWPGWAVCSRSTAKELLTRVGWDMREARDACRKANVVGASLNGKTIPALAPRTASDSYVELLIARRNGEAADAAVGLSAAESRRSIGMLDRSLDVLRRINKAVGGDVTNSGLSRALNVHYARVEALRPYAKHYDAGRTDRAYLALAKADADLSRGEREGVMESLAVTW